jgi:hypothetical protein
MNDTDTTDSFGLKTFDVVGARVERSRTDAPEGG